MTHIVRKYRWEILVAVLYSFRFVLKIYVDQNGNLDLFYLLAIWMLLSNISYRKVFCGVGVSTVLLSIIQITAIIGSPYQVDCLKGAFFILKLVLCIAAFLVIKGGYIKFNLRKFLDYVCVIFFLQTVVSLIFKTNITWRLVENRMELFYLEPSELGAFVSVLTILQLYYIREEKLSGKLKARSIRNLVILGADVVLSQSASAVVYLVVGIAIVFFYEVITMKINTSFFFKVFCLVTLVVVVGFYFLRGDAYLSLRIQGMLNGTDSSYNTRVVSSFDTLFRYYNQYGTIGCGFGNQTSDYGMSFFKLKDVNYRTCSTIAVFALEGGMIAGIVEVVFLIFCFKRVANHADGNRLRWALFSFVILYAFGGGYSTNPVLWMILGFAITDGMYYRIEEG